MMRGTVIAVRTTNREHLMQLGTWKMASAIMNYAEDPCAYCPRNMERRCNDDCRAGLREWLHKPYIPSSDVWKEKR